MTALILPQWFLDMTDEQICAAKCLIQCAVLRHALDESYLDGIAHKNLTESALDLCSRIANIQSIGEQLPVGEIMLTNVPFNQSQISGLIISRNIKQIQSLRIRGNIIIFTIQPTDEDLNSNIFKRTIHRTADRLYDIFHAESMSYNLN